MIELKNCPWCEPGRGHLNQIGTSEWWECDHCDWKGWGNQARIEIMRQEIATRPSPIAKPGGS